MKKTIFLKLKQILQKKFLINFRAFRGFDRLNEDLGLTHLELQELIWYMENEYNICIPDAALTKLRTLRDIVRCVDVELKNSSLYPLFMAEAVYQ